MWVPINLGGLHSHIRRTLLGVGLTLMVIPWGSSFTQRDILNPTPTMADVMEFMIKYSELPEYAQVRMTQIELRSKFKTRDVPAQFARLLDKWKKIIGERNWIYFHHYCRGILRYQEALRIIGGSEEAEIRRKHNLGMALSEFNFIENSQTDSSFPLWPQLYLYKFYIYSRLDQFAMAQKALQRAKELQKRSKSGQ